MLHCGDEIEFQRCEDCGHYTVKRASLCRDRLCPICSWRLALRRYSDMLKLMENLSADYIGYHYSFVTLTVKNCKLSALRKTISQMQICWNRIRQRKMFKTFVLGWAKSTEITRNGETGEYHPHYHIIFMWAKSDVCTPQSMAANIIRQWVDMVTADGMIASIDAQCGETIRDNKINSNSVISAVVETFKYAVKPSSLSDISASELRKFATAISSLRFVALGGIISSYAKKMRIDLESVSDSDDELNVCAVCKSHEIDTIIYKWAFGEKRYFIDMPNDSPELLTIIHDDDDTRARIASHQRNRRASAAVESGDK